MLGWVAEPARLAVPGWLASAAATAPESRGRSLSHSHTSKPNHKCRQRDRAREIQGRTECGAAISCDTMCGETGAPLPPNCRIWVCAASSTSARDICAAWSS